MTRVFVYGTLKRGCSNNGYLAGQRYIGEARTTPGFTLYLVTDYPGMVRSDDAADIVTGELWEVDDTCLTQLDALEGVDVGLYVREAITLEPPYAGQPVSTYVYLRSVTGLEQIGPTWLGE